MLVPIWLQLRAQHIGNLVFLLRLYSATRDWRRLAAVVATLMATEVRSRCVRHTRALILRVPLVAMLIHICCDPVPPSTSPAPRAAGRKPEHHH